MPPPGLFPDPLFLPTILPPHSNQNNHTEVQLKSGLLSTLKFPTATHDVQNSLAQPFMLMHATLSHFSNHRPYYSPSVTQYTSPTWLQVLILSHLHAFGHFVFP